MSVSDVVLILSRGKKGSRNKVVTEPCLVEGDYFVIHCISIATPMLLHKKSRPADVEKSRSGMTGFFVYARLIHT